MFRFSRQWWEEWGKACASTESYREMSRIPHHRSWMVGERRGGDNRNARAGRSLKPASSSAKLGRLGRGPRVFPASARRTATVVDGRRQRIRGREIVVENRRVVVLSSPPRIPPFLARGRAFAAGAAVKVDRSRRRRSNGGEPLSLHPLASTSRIVSHPFSTASHRRCSRLYRVVGFYVVRVCVTSHLSYLSIRSSKQRRR